MSITPKVGCVQCADITPLLTLFSNALWFEDYENYGQGVNFHMQHRSILHSEKKGTKLHFLCWCTTFKGTSLRF